MTAFNRARTKLNTRYAELHFQAALKDNHNQNQTRKPLALKLALLVSIAIISVSFAILGTGLAIIYLGTPHVLIMLAGALLVWLGWMLLPSRPVLSSDIATEEEYPNLYQNVGKVADALGVQMPNSIVLSSDFNAWVSSNTKQSQLGIGIPLWDGLNTDERTALIAHELGHLANNDPERGRISSSALQTIRSWKYFVAPDERYYSDGTHAYGSLSDQISNLFQGVALSIVSLVEWVLLRLTFAEHQRAEYNADAHATRVAGTTAKIQLLRKLLIIPELEDALSTLYPVTASKIEDTIKRELLEAATSRLDELEQVCADDLSAVDSSHPPTNYRLRFVRALKCSPIAHAIQPDWASVDEEFSRYRTITYKKLENSIHEQMGLE